jgi:hypothetical protein
VAYGWEEVYTEATYEELIDRVPKLLADQGWVVSSLEPGRDWQRTTGFIDWNERWGNADHGEWPGCPLLGAPSRTLADDYGEALIRVKDVRWAAEHDLLDYQDFPLVIQRAFSKPVNIVAVETTDRWKAVRQDATVAFADLLTRQRAALLRTFLAGRDVMLLDEPFGALDALTRQTMQSWLLEIWEADRKTIVFVTHDVEEAVFCPTGCAGFGLAIGSWVSAALILAVASAAHLPRIRIEEAELEQVLGDDYRDYERTTPRLVPGFW